MSSNFHRRLHIEITVNPENPELLTGLDVWLRLGLISEEQVNWLSRTYLTCPLPEVPKIPESESNFAPETIPREAETKLPRFTTPRVLQTLKNELNLVLISTLKERWLLFLGLFLVVISSGVMAANYWQNFPAALQYGILSTYTLVFWGVGFWASKQQNLQLTAQTLQNLTILLLPVNFWAMDTFHLWGNIWGWLTVAIASFLLTIIYLSQKTNKPLPLLLTFLILSYLHWGWNIPDFPLIAVTGGAILSALISLRFSQGNFIIYTLSVLLVRAIFVAHLPIQQLGLTLGICGWLLSRNGLTPPSPPLVRGGATTPPLTKGGLGGVNSPALTAQVFQLLGAILLLLGWLVSVGEKFPLQAIIISGFALHISTKRLIIYWLKRDLFAIFLISFQGLFLLRQLIPTSLLQGVINFSLEITNSEAFSYSLYSITLFPYLIGWLFFTEWIYQKNQPKLARFGEFLGLTLEIILTLLSLFNPTWRSLNLFLSTITLTYFTHKRHSHNLPLIYFTHIFGLFTITATLDWWFSPLSQSIWAIILLLLMIVEWGISTLNTPNSDYLKNWYNSCWYLGFILAGISFVFLYQTNTFTSLFWLLTPLTLTIVASRKHTQLAASFSCATLILAQYLTLPQPELRIISLAFATGLMLFNTYYLPNLLLAVINIGFAVSFIGAFLWGNITDSGWLLVGAIALSSLFFFPNFLPNKTHPLFILYTQAAKSWAIFLCIFELTILTLTLTPNWAYLAASAIITTAIIYHFKQNPRNLTSYGIGWAIEITLFQLIFLAGGSNLTLATGNIILGLILLHNNPFLSNRLTPNSLNILPLIYAIIAIICRLNHFTPYTGLITFGAALIGIGIGYKKKEWKPISYLSLIGISLAGYEIVIYQMLKQPSGNSADGLTILALVAATFALIYRLLAWVIKSHIFPPLLSLTRENNTFLNFSLTEIKTTAHIHWAIGSILKVLTAGIAIENKPSLTLLSVAVSLILAAYALIQGRDETLPPNPPLARGEKGILTASDWWVYVGLVEILGTFIYARLIWQKLSFLDTWQVIVFSMFALAIYQIPWQSWGWKLTPWHRTALVIPALTAMVTIEEISYLSLLVVAAFYVRIAIKQQNIRWSYVSLAFVNWAIARWLSTQNLTDILYNTSLISLSLLYISQLDPILKTQRKNRHYLRITGSVIICLVALLFHQKTGIIPGIISLAFILAGLSLRIRAFLFVGTSTFILTAFYQLIVLIFTYSFLKWIIGLTTGILLITIAANFERRRQPIIPVLQRWYDELNQWE